MRVMTMARGRHTGNALPRTHPPDPDEAATPAVGSRWQAPAGDDDKRNPKLGAYQNVYSA
jgi:hypothetical protein